MSFNLDVLRWERGTALPAQVDCHREASLGMSIQLGVLLHSDGLTRVRPNDENTNDFHVEKKKKNGML